LNKEIKIINARFENGQVLSFDGRCGFLIASLEILAVVCISNEFAQWNTWISSLQSRRLFYIVQVFTARLKLWKREEQKLSRFFSPPDHLVTERVSFSTLSWKASAHNFSLDANQSKANDLKLSIRR